MNTYQKKKINQIHSQVYYKFDLTRPKLKIIKNNKFMSSMSESQEVEMREQKKMPEIGTEIFDKEMPSELNFHSSSILQNPEQEHSWKNENDCDVFLKQFTVKGKGLFSVGPKYQHAELIRASTPTYLVKAFDEQSSGGLRKIWESVVGYCKKEVIFQDGYMYTLARTKDGLIRHGAHEVAKLLKIFIDTEEKLVRLVFKEDGGQRKNRNYKVEDLVGFMERLVLQANVLGLEITQDDDF